MTLISRADSKLMKRANEPNFQKQFDYEDQKYDSHDVQDDDDTEEEDDDDVDDDEDDDDEDNGGDGDYQDGFLGLLDKLQNQMLRYRAKSPKGKLSVLEMMRDNLVENISKLQN